MEQRLMRYHSALIWVWLIGAMYAADCAAVNDRLPKPNDVSKEWQGGTGVVIADLHNPPAFFAQSMAEVIAEYRSIGVKSMANLAYRKITNLTHQVELKWFEFESIEAATRWRQKKYGHENWQQFYTRTYRDGLVIYDSLEINKRIVFYQRYWITASAPGDSNDHLLFLDQAIKRVKK